MKIIFNVWHYLLLNVFLLGFICVCSGDNVKKSVDDNRDDNGDNNDEAKDEMEIPAEIENNTVACARRENSRMHAIQEATERQFPFMAALMSNLDEYLCAGSIVSNGMILTSASCTTQSIGYVIINSIKAKKDKGSVQLHVLKTELFPTFTGGESLKNVALVFTEKHNGTVATKIKISNYTNPRSLLDIEAIGYGLNTDFGEIRPLQYVGLENRSPFEIGNIVKGYIDCIDTTVRTCFKDQGGPAIFDYELIGIITEGQLECSKEINSIYAINKKMVTVLPTFAFKTWLDERINANENTTPVFLSTFPSKPIGRQRLASAQALAPSPKVKEKSYKTSAGVRLANPSIFLIYVGVNFFFLWIIFDQFSCSS